MPQIELTDEELRQMKRVYERLAAYRKTYLLTPSSRPPMWWLWDGTSDDFIKAFSRMLEQTTTTEAVFEKLNGETDV